jgi:hypothetical protein
MKFKLSRALVITGFLVWTPAAGAQTPAPTEPAPDAQQPELPPRAPERRPYRGIFGGGDAIAGGPGLALRAAVFGGYDDNVIAGQSGSVGDRRPVAGSFAAAAGNLTYLVTRGRKSFGFSGASQYRYYDADGSWQQFNHAVDAGLSLPVGRRAMFDARQSARFSPYYQFDVAPGLPSSADGSIIEPPVVSPDDSLVALDSQTYYSSLGLSHPVGRGGFRYNYGYRTNNFDDRLFESSAHSAGADYSRRVSRYGTLRLGYGYRAVGYRVNAERDVTMHNINIGGAYARPLSFSRRTTVGVSGGTAMVNARDTRRYRIVADATVHHEMGRTWVWRGAYTQGLQVVDVFPEPLFGHAVRTTLTGLIGRNYDVAIDGGYLTGGYTSGQQADAYGSYHGSATLRRALGRSLAAYVEYSYYKYSFEDPTTLQPFFGRDFERHGVRVGLTLWLPIFSQRQIDASR